jgi:CDP-diacylglycerol--glycerol-3-phosphate 3-phosphatidyltransferase
VWQETFLRILLTPVFVILLFSSDPTMLQWSLAVLIFAAITDWYDGWLARRWGYVTRWGVFFDPLADKVVTSGALFAYLYLGLVPGWTVWVIVIRDIFITLLRS